MAETTVWAVLDVLARPCSAQHWPDADGNIVCNVHLGILTAEDQPCTKVAPQRDPKLFAVSVPQQLGLFSASEGDDA